VDRAKDDVEIGGGLVVDAILHPMNETRLHRHVALALLIIAGCGSDPRADSGRAHPPSTPTPENPIVFNVDMSTPLPLVTLLATPEEGSRLRNRYSSFFVQMGPPGPASPLSLRFDKKGSLGNPWNFYLRNFSSPYPVRLMGILPDGKKELIHEETF